VFPAIILTGFRDLVPPPLRLAVWAVLASVVASGQPVSAATGQLEFTIVDKDTGKPIPCRVHLVGPKKRPFNPGKVPFWNDHFVLPGKMLLKLPLGNYTFVMERGPEYLDQTGHFTINTFADDAKRVEMRRFTDMAADGWWSGDLDVRRPVRDVELLMLTDDLHVAEVITWRNGKIASGPPLPEEPVIRFDGNRYYSPTAGALMQSGTELLLLNLPAPLKLSAINGDYPPIIELLLDARKKGSLWVDASRPFWWDLPMLIANGQIDSIEVAHAQMCRETVIPSEKPGRPRDRARYPDPWGNARWSLDVYFRLLEAGLRIPPSAGSGSGESPNPVGYNRAYVHVADKFTYEKFWESLRAGRVFVTNGPLLKPSVEGQLPGHVFQAENGAKLDLQIALTLSTREPISYLEIIKNGKIEHSISFDTYSKSGKLPPLHFDRSGWFLVRAVTDLPKTYRFAMTGPYYVQIGPQPRISRGAVQFFVDWVYERARQIQLDDPKQRKEVLRWHRNARDYWQNLLSKANGE
jgi:hypothetical protein